MNKIQTLISFALLSLSLLPLRAIEITKTTCEMQEGLVVVDASPRLGWAMQSDKNGTLQTAYEIEIKEACTGRRVWSSGKIASSQSQLVSAKGAGFSDNARSSKRTPYNFLWRVRVWDENDQPSAWSHESAFRIASPHFDQGTWIGAITRRDARLPEGRKFHGTELKNPEVKALWDAVDTLAKKSICLRKSFATQTRKEIAEATATVCGLGHYEFSLNGTKVGDGEFTPLWSDYDKTVYYNTFDVTQQLRKGDNAIGVLLGNGFYNVQGGRYRKLQISFGAPTLLFKLLIHYTDGTSEEVVSDQDWKYTLSPLTFNCIYGGEDYDARLEQEGWNKPGFKDAAWRPVVVQEAPKGVLRPQLAAPVKIMEHYGIQKVTKLTPEQIASACQSTKRTIDPSAFVLDMGQNLAGFPEIKVQGKRGQKITLLVAEALTEEGACNQRQTGRQHYYQYTLKGHGVETWHPRFSYYGFRYIQVEGAVLKGEKNPAKLPLLKEIRSCFIYNSAPKVSTFETSNPLFNATHRLIEKAVRSNMQSVFTDCPHREKLGWLEQVHLNGPGLLYNYDLTAYAPQIMQNMADAQHPDGAMPTTAPEYVLFEGPGMDAFAQSPEWGSTLVVLPFLYYEAYGDDALIKKYYPQMRRYVDSMTERADSSILSFGLGDWYDYGDFRAGFSRNTPVPLVATAHYYMDIDYLVRAARMVGNAFDVYHYTALAQQVNEAFCRKFLRRETAQVGSGSQCSHALPLFLNMLKSRSPKGLFEPDQPLAEAVLKNLLKDIAAHGNRLTTGDVGNRYLIQTLVRAGEHELLYQMFNHEEAPGYGFQLKFGATTLTEQWDPRQGSSWNHFMMGQIDEWFFNSLVGIRSATAVPGYQEVEIRPCPVGDLTFVRGSTETLYGNVAVEWTREKGVFTLHLSIPVNASASVYLPGEKEPRRVTSGKHTFTVPMSDIRI